MFDTGNKYCFEGICPGNYQRSNLFRVLINIELAKMNLVWKFDGDGLERTTNWPDSGEIAYLSTDEFVGELDVQKDEFQNNITKAFNNYFTSYKDLIKRVEDSYTIIEELADISLEDYPEEHRALYQLLIFKFVNNVGPLIDELYVLQANPNVLPMQQQAMEDFKDNKSWEFAYKLLSYNIAGICPAFLFDTEPDPTCSLFPVPPDKPSINALMPWDVTPKEWEFVDMACRKYGGPSPLALMSDTVVEWVGEKPREVLEKLAKNFQMIEKSRDEKKRKAFLGERNELLKELYASVKATLLPEHPVFKNVCERLAKELRNLASLELEGVELKNIEPLLAGQLETAAIYFEKGDLESATEAMRHAILPKDGPFVEVTQGSESYWPTGPKHWAWACIGRYNRDYQDHLEKYQKYMVITKECRDKGQCSPTGRQVSVKIIDVYSFFGALVSPDGTTAGWNKHNNPYFKINEHDVVIVKNVFDQLSEGEVVLRKVLMGDYDRYLTPSGIYSYTQAHETGHGLLEGDNVVIENGPDESISVKPVFQNYWLWFKETRADLQVPISIKNMLTDKNINYNSEEGKKIIEDAKELLFNYIYFTVKNCPENNELFTINEAHSASEVIRCGWFIRNGLCRLEKSGDKLKLVFSLGDPDKITRDKMLSWLDVEERLYEESEKFIKTGDVDGYVAYVRKIAREVSPEFYTFTNDTRRQTLVIKGKKNGKRRSIMYKVPD